MLAGFSTLLKRNGIIQSMSLAETPHDNAVIESFFGWFKEELSLDFHFKQSNEIFAVIRIAVDFFNFLRPVTGRFLKVKDDQSRYRYEKS